MRCGAHLCPLERQAGSTEEIQWNYRVTRINKVSYETVCIHMDKAAHVVCIASHKETPKRLLNEVLFCLN